MRQSLGRVKNHQRVAVIAVFQYQAIQLAIACAPLDAGEKQRQAIQLVRQPRNGERSCDGHAHPGDFASCLLLGCCS